MSKHYSKDPYKLNLKYGSNCAKCNVYVFKGQPAYYWPSTRSVFCPACGEPEYRQFRSAAADEDVYNGSGNPYASEPEDDYKDVSEWPIISSYTRKQAIEDGFQVEVEMKTCKAAGIQFPVYMTRAAWDRYVEVPKELKGWQDLSGRLWDILFMFALSARNTEGAHLSFQFVCQIPDHLEYYSNEKAQNGNRYLRLITLESVIGPQDIDDASPAITIMLPGED